MKPPATLCPSPLGLYVRIFTYTANFVNPLTQKLCVVGANMPRLATI